jgi:hypothetical protein
LGGRARRAQPDEGFKNRQHPGTFRFRFSVAPATAHSFFMKKSPLPIVCLFLLLRYLFAVALKVFDRKGGSAED